MGIFVVIYVVVVMLCCVVYVVIILLYKDRRYIFTIKKLIFVIFNYRFISFFYKEERGVF